jgi:hypothetical protein
MDGRTDTQRIDVRTYRQSEIQADRLTDKYVRLSLDPFEKKPKTSGKKFIIFGQKMSVNDLADAS